MPHRIAIFDDNKDIRESIALLLQTEKEFEVTGSFAHVLDCVQELKQCKPDVVLMDIEMPEMTGIEAVKQIKKELPDMLILMQTVFEDDDRVFDSICAGASGYILKNEIDCRLITAIKELQEGGSPMSPSIARKILTTMQQVPQLVQPQQAQDYQLTPREKEVLACVVNGLSYKMIADQLFVSHETIRTHIKRIYKKLHVASLTEMVGKVMREKIV
jgi:DNA-binding NarL/FixJ family response regulator